MAWALALALTGCASRPVHPEAPSARTPEPQRLSADLHIHLTMREAARPLFQGEPGSGPLADSPDDIFTNQVEAAGLSASGTRLLVAALWPPTNLRPGRDETALAIHQLEQLERFTRGNRQFAWVESAEQARRALARGRFAVLPSVEGAEGIHSSEDVDLYFAHGARVITLVHFVDNELGGAAKGQLGRAFGFAADETNEQGLTPLGRELVERMFDLGIVVDLAHASDVTSRDVLTMAEARGVPVINSHAGRRAFSGMERNLSDELAVRIAKGGGMFGVTLYRSFLEGVPAEAQLAGHVERSCDDVVAHWLAWTRIVPAESLALGSDFNGAVVRAHAGGRCPGGLATTADLPQLYAALEQAGVPAEAIDGSGERFLKLLEAVEAKAKLELREAARKKRRLERDELFPF